MVNINFLNRFLLHYKSDEGYTNTSLVGGKWDIPDKDYDLFIKLYVNALRQGHTLYLTEKHLLDRSPVIIDLDIKGMMVSDSQVKSIVKIINNNILHLIDKLCDEEHRYVQDYTCYVSKRDRIDANKDGLHIHYPYIITSYMFQFKLRDISMHQVKEILANSTNDAQDIYDYAAIKRNPWTMYGSTKKDRPCYDIKYTFNKEGHRYRYLTIPLDLYKLVKMLSVRAIGMHTIPIYDVQSIYTNNVLPDINDVDTSEISALLDKLPDTYVDSYPKWINVGLALYNHDSSDDMLYAWDAWSRHSDKYKEGECARMWSRFTYKAGGLNLDYISNIANKYK